MFGWRKRDDGFEWHKYVRTTIKLRRDARRDKAERIKQQAVDGARAASVAAGAAAREGVKVAGSAAREGAKMAGGAAMQGAQLAGSAAGFAAKASAVWVGASARIAASFLGTAWRAGASGSRVAARVLGEKLAPPLRPVLDILGRPNVAMPLALAGGIAFIAGLLRAGIQHSMDRDAGAAILIGALCLLLAYLPRLLLGTGAPMPAFLARLHPHVRTALATCAGFIILAAAATTFWPSRGGLPSLPISTASLSFGNSKTVEGRAAVVGPELIRVGTSLVRLSGVEALDREQRCARPGNKRWRCGEAATAALQRLASGRVLKCNVGNSTDAAGAATGVCFDGTTDINAAYVKSGHAFAATGMFARYTSAEMEAKTAKVGLWAGDAERPSEWRSKVWDEAKRRAPDGCPVKGHVSGNARLYVLPWSSDYDRVRVNAARGGRWFCTEEEAIGAGWKASARG